MKAGKVSVKNGIIKHGASARWEEVLSNGTKILYSYSTVVGVYIYRQDTLLLTTKSYSVTTSKHVAAFAREYNFAAHKQDASETALRDFVQVARQALAL